MGDEIRTRTQRQESCTEPGCGARPCTVTEHLALLTWGPSHLGLSVLHFQEASCSPGQAPQPLPKPVFSRMGRPGLAHSPPQLSEK